MLLRALSLTAVLALGARCSVDEMRSCDYDAKLSCACMPSQCTTAAGPIPDCKEAWTWVCRKDGCPIIAKQGACSSEGKVCDYDDGLCSSQVTCTKGRWTGVGALNCRPAAPPHR